MSPESESDSGPEHGQPVHRPDGRRIELSLEVPGSVEEVWRTIATGPGITSWFVPTEVEERAGGTAS